MNSGAKIRYSAGRFALAAALLMAALVAAACAGTTSIPEPRPLIVSSGARLAADKDRLQQIYDWLIPEAENIELDPTFFMVSIEGEEDLYPWETLVISQRADTARYRYGRSNPDVETSYNIYAHLHLMDQLGRLGDWLPEATALQGFQRERAFVKRMADSWLLGRSIFDAQPHALMDQLIYASEQGYLDQFLFTTRPEEWPDARRAWLEQNPDGLRQYEAWFRDTFKTDPHISGKKPATG